jgi:serine/threonine protein kinase/formylglycine-generating enzyme required for sulfatase activity/Tfp pilus assembly protein PilF
MIGGSACDEDLVRRLPLPLAQLYRRAHNAKSALDRHNAAYCLWEASLKLLSSVAVVACAERGAVAQEWASRLRNLARPALGHWWEFVRLLVPVLADAGDAGFGQVCALLLGRPRDDLPRAAGLDAALREALDGTTGARVTVRVSELFERMLRYRNRELGHGAHGQRDIAFYDRMGAAMLLGMGELLGQLDVLAGRRLVFVADVRRLGSGCWLIERLELVGESPRRLESLERPESEAALLPRPGRLYVEGASESWSLYPLVLCDAEATEVFFLNTRRGQRRTEYLCYHPGRVVERTDLEAEQRALLAWVLATEVDRGLVEQWAAGSQGEDPPLPPDVAAEPTAPRRHLGEFELLSELGRGGMGVVYRAWQPSLGRQVALKCLLRTGDPKADARFNREIHALGRVEHPHLIKVFTSGAEAEQWFYTMELVEGATLAAVCGQLRGAGATVAEVDLVSWRAALGSACRAARQAERLLSDSGDDPHPAWPKKSDTPVGLASGDRDYVCHVVELVRQVTTATHALHEAGVIHRDIKPDNILVTPDGAQAVLMDLGLAQLADESEGRLTRTRQFVGTLRYASPEQVLSVPLDRRSDVYSLGATLWELLTLRPLFGATEQTPTPELMLKVQSADPESPRQLNPRVPADLEGVVLKCLEKDRSRRYATASELAVELGRWLNGEPVHARSPTLRYLLGKYVRRHRRPIAVSSVATVLVLSVLLLTSWLSHRGRARQADVLLAEGREQLDRATRAFHADADRLFEEAMQSFVAAQAIDPRPSRARSELMQLYLRRCEHALESDEFDAARALILPLRNIDRSRTAAARIAELERRALGTSRWRIDSTPQGCEVALTRIDTGIRRENPRKLGRTPLDEQDIAPGDYLLSLSHSGFAELRYPIRIGRNETRQLLLVLLHPDQIPQGMVFVPGGPFLFGDPQSETVRSVEVESFFIDRTEVTGAEYERFVQATGTPPPELWGGSRTCPAPLRGSPVYNVSWFDAYAYARWADKRLPTEAEWEKAARGVDGRPFPWGTRFDPKRVASRALLRTVLQAGRHRDGASPYGCLDMAGNVWEWTLDQERAGEEDRVIRGGASSSTPDELLTYRRKSAPPGGSEFGGLNLLGFRCVRPLRAEPGAPSLFDALTTGPDLAAAAEYFCEQGRWLQGRECCRRLLDLNPRSVPGNFWLASCLEREGKTPEALIALRLVFFQKFNYRGRSRSLQDDLIRLLGAEEKAGRKPDRTFLNAPRWFRLARQALDANEPTKARTLLEQVLKWDPDNGVAHEQMATVEAKCNSPALAAMHRGKRIEGYRLALRETPEDPGLIHEFAEFLLNNDLEPTEAAKLANRAVALNPYAPSYRKTYAELLARASRWEEAIAQVREAIELDPEDDAVNNLLESYKNHARQLESTP